MPSPRIAFYVPRNNHMKIVAPVIDYMLRRRTTRFEITLIIPQWARSKIDHESLYADVSSLFGDQVTVSKPAEVCDLLRSIRSGFADAIVNVSAQVPEIGASDLREMIAESRKVGTKWIALPYTLSADYFVDRDPELAADVWDLICLPGNRSLEYAEATVSRLPRKLAEGIRRKLAVSGYPELDGISSLQGPSGIRSKYGLPEDREILFLSPAPLVRLTGSRMERTLEARFRGSDRASRKARLASFLRFPALLPYIRYLRKLRTFADNNNLYIVAKTRSKHEDPEYLREYADVIVGDVTFFPFTTLELLSISRLYFGFASAAVIESIAAKVYSVTAAFLPRNIARPDRVSRRFDRYNFTGVNGLWNTPGVSELVRGASMGGLRRMNEISKSRLSDFEVDEERRKDLAGRYFSYVGCSSARVVDLLLGQLG